VPCINNYYLHSFTRGNENVSDEVLRRIFGPNQGNNRRLEKITK
jgi:hypothetical protein